MSTKSATSTPSASPQAYSQRMRHRTQQQRHYFEKSDDADAAAGGHPSIYADFKNDYRQPKPMNGKMVGVVGSETDLLLPSSPKKDDDDTLYANIPISQSSLQESPKVLVFGRDISHLSRKCQFITCASGVFTFSLLYGFLQELISVTLCSRQLGLFLAMVQFMGYAIWSRFFNSYVQRKHFGDNANRNVHGEVPVRYYILLSILRAIDASMTNMAMAYINYPAKTLMKSSRVVFTMLFSTIVSRKRYNFMDYFVVLLMVSGLVIFMHADSQNSAVFQPLGIFMLTTSLCCDAVITNMSEKIMNQYNVGQDEFIYKLYSIALVGIVGAAAVRGDLMEGTQYLLTPGTYSEIIEGKEATWSVNGKILAFALFSSTGFLGSSCSALITKEFGALTMSITSTARKATTLFLSFALFNNVCTKEHIGGIILFIMSLVGKSVRASRKGAIKVSGSHNGDNSAYHKKGESLQVQTQYIDLDSSISGTPFERYGSDGIKRRSHQRNLGDIV